MATKSSVDSFYNSKNVRDTHKERVFRVMFLPRTIREAARATGLNYRQVQKRVTDLYQAGRIKIIGDKLEHGTANSIYVDAKNIGNEIIKPETLKKWLSAKHPEILFEYESTKLHKL